MKDKGLRGLRLDQLALKDLTALMALQETVMTGLPSQEWYVPSTEEEQVENLQNGDVFGCWDGGKLAGFSVLTPWMDRGEKAYGPKVGEPAEGTYDLHDMMVDPDYRRRGIHSALLRLFDETVKILGGHAIYATISPDNLPSIKGFEKAGYMHMKTQPAYDGRLRGYYKKII